MAKIDRPFQCQECGKRMTVKQAERAAFGERGCLDCGSSDVDLATDRVRK
jgi:DNA-directed RNA polymerase subunit RPC12/RpoP